MLRGSALIKSCARCCQDLEASRKLLSTLYAAACKLLQSLHEKSNIHDRVHFSVRVLYLHGTSSVTPGWLDSSGTKKMSEFYC